MSKLLQKLLSSDKKNFHFYKWLAEVDGFDPDADERMNVRCNMTGAPHYRRVKNYRGVKWEKRPIRINNKVSIVFSWDLWNIIEAGPPLFDLVYGGPALKINSEWLPSWMKTAEDEPFLQHHNSQATRTTLGCIRNCPFCIVPKLEGRFRELNDFEVKPILIDNNFLASSRKHFDKVIDRLKQLDWCDFNQGIDPRLMTPYIAGRLAELNIIVRLSMDSEANVKHFKDAYEMLRKVGIPKKNIRVYILIGFNDTPEDALYRLEYARNLGIKPNPMRYQPINTKQKNSFVSETWTAKELGRYMRYWSRLAYVSGIPFEKWVA